MRYFFVKFNDYSELMSIEEFRNFIVWAIFSKTRDIQTFIVTEIDSRLTYFQAAVIAREYNLANEVIEEIVKGARPDEALLKWIK